jgi:peptidoglycan hydrolase-like protein with peptidoglycan-binding domain
MAEEEPKTASHPAQAKPQPPAKKVPEEKAPASPADDGGLSQGDTGPEVLELQQSLATLGLEEGMPFASTVPQDGTYTLYTARAVQEAQEHLGQEPHGTADDELLSALG